MKALGYLEQGRFLDFVENYIQNLSLKEVLKFYADNTVYSIEIGKTIIKTEKVIMVISSNNDFILSTSFGGNFKITISDVKKELGFYRKIYVPYDDAYHLFFNENYEKGAFTITLIVKNISDELTLINLLMITSKV